MKIQEKCDSIENSMDISLEKQKWNRINWHKVNFGFGGKVRIKE